MAGSHHIVHASQQVRVTDCPLPPREVQGQICSTGPQSAETHPESQEQVSQHKPAEVDGIRAAEVMLSDFHSPRDAWENQMSGQ